MSTDVARETEIVYPESDGKPMADNTLQWDWMVKIVGELRGLYAGQQVFVAGDLFWYPVEGDPKEVAAPDALVAFGRPPGYRGSYKQWEEGGVAPQVVFEVLSPNNTQDDLDEKYRFYSRHGVEEYYFIDPYRNRIEGYRRDGELLIPVWVMDGYVSPRLGIRFETGDELKLYTPDGREFQTREDREQEILDELHRTASAFEQERERAVAEFQRAEQERLRAERESERAEQLFREAEEARQQATAAVARAEEELRVKEAYAAKLRELGIDPDAILKPSG